MADDLMTIDPDALAGVTGGRYTAGPETIKPELIQGIGELAKAVSAVGQSLAAVKQQSEGQKLQVLQQVLQQKAGGGPARQSSSLSGSPSWGESAAGAF